jgi:hypothetical protein
LNASKSADPVITHPAVLIVLDVIAVNFDIAAYESSAALEEEAPNDRADTRARSLT